MTSTLSAKLAWFIATIASMEMIYGIFGQLFKHDTTAFTWVNSGAITFSIAGSISVLSIALENRERLANYEEAMKEMAELLTKAKG